ncbi:hypothetical protein [Spirosoma sp. KNUC1025]|uniref:hypothetical protein n=1 Tax=Spirosoma sp. KNUC1025 TaxID=2894082 RepID=UPI00386A511D|nr:hypothetical protein LN737_15550 [Spirosoma sp. KNUC1025]
MAPVNEQLTPVQPSVDFSPLRLQTAINKLDAKNTALNLYVTTNQQLANVPVITVPARFQLYAMVDSTNQPRAYLAVKDNKKLFVNRSGKLTSSTSLDPSVRFQSAPAYSGPMNTLISYRNANERQTVKAALAALSDVYSLDLTIDERPVPNRQYQWILTDQLPKKYYPKHATLFRVWSNEIRPKMSFIRTKP